MRRELGSARRSLRVSLEPQSHSLLLCSLSALSRSLSLLCRVRVRRRLLCVLLARPSRSSIESQRRHHDSLGLQQQDHLRDHPASAFAVRLLLHRRPCCCCFTREAALAASLCRIFVVVVAAAAAAAATLAACLYACVCMSMSPCLRLLRALVQQRGQARSARHHARRL